MTWAKLVVHVSAFLRLTGKQPTLQKTKLTRNAQANWFSPSARMTYQCKVPRIPKTKHGRSLWPLTNYVWICCFNVFQPCLGKAMRVFLADQMPVEMLLAKTIESLFRSTSKTMGQALACSAHSNMISESEFLAIENVEPTPQLRAENDTLGHPRLYSAFCAWRSSGSSGAMVLRQLSCFIAFCNTFD